MRFSRNLLIFTLLLTFLVGVFLLPQFSLDLGGRTFTWPAIDFSATNIKSTFANFRKGAEIYEGIVVTGSTIILDSQEEDADELINSDLTLIRKRMDKAGLSDVDLTSIRSGEKNLLSLSFPKYYQQFNLDRISSFLLSSGSFQIIENDNEAPKGSQVDPTLDKFFPGYVSKEGQVRSEDIEEISIVSDSRFGTNLLKFRFTQNAAIDIVDMIARVDTTGDVRPPVVAIDGIPQFVFLDSGEELTLYATPLDSTTDSIQLRIISEYATEEAGPRLSYENLETTELKAVYALQGRTTLGITFVVGALFLAVWSLRKFELIGGFTFLASLLTYLAYSLGLLKLIGMPISSGVLIGFMLMYALGAVVIYDLMLVKKLQLELRLKLYKDLSAFIFVIASVLFMAGVAFGLFAEVIATIAFMSLGLFLVSIFGFKQILLNFHINRTQDE